GTRADQRRRVIRYQPSPPVGAQSSGPRRVELHPELLVGREGGRDQVGRVVAPPEQQARIVELGMGQRRPGSEPRAQLERVVEVALGVTYAVDRRGEDAQKA